MNKKRMVHLIMIVGFLSVFAFIPMVYGLSEAFKENIPKEQQELVKNYFKSVVEG